MTLRRSTHKDELIWVKISALLLDKLGLKELRITEDDIKRVLQSNAQIVARGAGQDVIVSFMTHEQMKEAEQAEQAQEGGQ